MEEIHQGFAPIVSMKDTFDCIQRVSRSTLRLTFRDAMIMEAVIFVGLTVRSHLITVTPVHSRKWVTITRLPYGTPRDAIDLAFRNFGPITRIRADTVNGISTGEFSILMEVRIPIPCRVSVNGHSAYTRYRGQKQTCYRCGQEGHVVQKCPKSNRSADPQSSAFADPPLDTLQVGQRPLNYAQALAAEPTLLATAPLSNDATRASVEITETPTESLTTDDTVSPTDQEPLVTEQESPAKRIKVVIISHPAMDTGGELPPPVSSPIATDEDTVAAEALPLPNNETEQESTNEPDMHVSEQPSASEESSDEETVNPVSSNSEQLCIDTEVSDTPEGFQMVKRRSSRNKSKRTSSAERSRSKERRRTKTDLEDRRSKSVTAGSLARTRTSPSPLPSGNKGKKKTKLRRKKGPLRSKGSNRYSPLPDQSDTSHPEEELHDTRTHVPSDAGDTLGGAPATS